MKNTLNLIKSSTEDLILDEQSIHKYDVVQKSLADDNQTPIILNSYEEGLILEKELKSMNNNYSYDVVGKVPYNYYTILKLIKENICDGIGPTDSDCADDITNIIRYKDREYGNLIRRYNLTARGFAMNIMFWFDGD